VINVLSADISMLEDRSNTKAISTALRRQSPGAANINFKSFKTDKKNYIPVQTSPKSNGEIIETKPKQ
jgi:hypothetical protein